MLAKFHPLSRACSHHNPRLTAQTLERLGVAAVPGPHYRPRLDAVCCLHDEPVVGPSGKKKEGKTG